MKIADLYIRARCDNRASQFIFEKQQEKALEEYCTANGIIINTKVFDNCSAGNFKRPGWSLYYDRLVSSSVRPDLLLFTSWDRFSRNIAEMISIRSNLSVMGISAMPIDTHYSFEEAIQLYNPQNEDKTRAAIALSFLF